MSRLFLRLYIWLSIALAAVIALGMLSVRSSLDTDLSEQIATLVRGPINLALQEPDPVHALRQMYPDIPLLQSVEDPSRALLDDGEVRITLSGRSAAFATIGIDGAQYGLGPVPLVRFVEGHRGLTVWGVQFLGLAVAITLLLRPVERRLRKLGATAQQFGAGDLDARSGLNGTDAIDELGRRFDEMAARIGGLLGSQHELVGAISHELRTPVTRLRYGVEMLELDLSTPAQREHVSRLNDDIDELEALIAELLEFTRAELVDRGTFVDVDLSELVTLTAEAVGPLRPEISIDVTIPDRSVTVRADPRLLRRAVQNLAANAVRYADAEAQITVDMAERGILLHVDDDGPGVPAAERHRIFEAFTRLDSARSRDRGGFGLGLAIARRVAERHHATLTVTDGPQGGARFTLNLGAPEGHS